MGAIANFGTDATGFSRLFPGLTPHLLTLANNFHLPLYRELLLALGVSSVSMKSCQNILRQGQLPTGIPFPSLSDSIADEEIALRHHHPRT